MTHTCMLLLCRLASAAYAHSTPDEVCGALEESLFKDLLTDSEVPDGVKQSVVAYYQDTCVRGSSHGSGGHTLAAVALAITKVPALVGAIPLFVAAITLKSVVTRTMTCDDLATVVRLPWRNASRRLDADLQQRITDCITNIAGILEEIREGFRSSNDLDSGIPESLSQIAELLEQVLVHDASEFQPRRPEEQLPEIQWL